MNLKTNNTMLNYCMDESAIIYIKKHTLENNLDNIENLFLGSSHVDCSIVPGYIENYFNLGLKSIDLYYLSKIYEKYICLMPKLKNVYLFYSPFLYGWDLQQTKFYHYCHIFKIIFGINYRYNNILFKLRERSYRKKVNDIIAKIDKKLLETNNGYLGGLHYNLQKQEINNIDEVISQLKENVRNSNNSLYLDKICELSKKFNKNLVMVLPPFPKFYKEMMPSEKLLYRDVYRVNKKYNIEIIDMYKTNYDDSYFTDTDHVAMIKGGGDRMSQDFANLIIK